MSRKTRSGSLIPVNVVSSDELGSAYDAVHVVTDDSATIQKTRGLYVGTSGDVRVTMAGGHTVTYKNLSAGIIHPIEVVAVKSTGTTATDILAVY